MSQRILRIFLPLLVLALVVVAWDGIVRALAIPPYILPGPGLVLSTLIADRGLLWQSLLVTLGTTFEGFVWAAIGGIGHAHMAGGAFNHHARVPLDLDVSQIVVEVRAGKLRMRRAVARFALHTAMAD